MAAKAKTTKQKQSLVANWHPYRYKILTELTEREASPKMLAPILGEPVVSNVSYHCRKLEEDGLIEEVRSVPRRGALEHFFKATIRPIISDEEWQELPMEAREEFSETILMLWSMDLSAAVKAATLDAEPERHFTRTPLQLDAQGFADLLREVKGLLYRSLEIQAESDERRSVSGEPALPVASLLGCFLMPAPD